MLFLFLQTAVFLGIAMLIGVAVGWLLAPRAAAPAVAAQPLAAGPNEDLDRQVAELRASLEERDADVQRLRGKLRRAATELEKRAGQVMAARRSHAEAAAHAEGLTSQLAGLEAEKAHLLELQDQAISNPTLWAAEADAALIENAVRARTQEIEAELAPLRARSDRADALEFERDELSNQLRQAHEDLADLERRSADAAEEATSVRAELSDAQQRHSLAQRDHETALTTIGIELSAARLRGESAAKELAELEAALGIVSEDSRMSAESLRARFDGLETQLRRARATLTGQVPSPAIPGAGVAARRPGPATGGIDTLPGVTPALVGYLQEFGVTSLADVADWTDADVDQYEAWLEQPGVVVDNDWVGYARRALSANDQPGV